MCKVIEYGNVWGRKKGACYDGGVYASEGVSRALSVGGAHR